MTVDRDSATGLKLYVNSNKVAETDPTNASHLFTIVYLQWRMNYGFADQPRFYFDHALTQVEIDAIYNGGAGVKVDEAAIAASGYKLVYAECDEGTGNPVGRYYNGSVWANVSTTWDGTWVSGGVPFDSDSSGYLVELGI